jgi:FHS family Na+ dependent glucose MFS transporter 1
MHSLSTSIVSLHSYVEPHDNKKKTTDTKPSIIYFLALFYVFLSMGFGTGLIGPTLLKFGEQTKSPLDQLVYLLFARSFGFLFGTLIGGVLIDRFAAFGRILLTFAVFVMCITTLSMPFMYHLIPMIIVHLLWGFTAGIVDNLAQILTIRHYENSNVNPYLQALHGAFGIGAFLSPLIIAPFLGKSKPINDWHYAYWLIGCLHIPNIIWIFIYAVRNECCSKKIQEINLENKEFVSETKQIDDVIPSDEKKTKSSDNSSSKSLLILILITIFILLYVGTESAFGSYLHTYASLHLHFEKDIAAYLNSVFWFSFTIGRLCGIPFSIKFSPLQMIFTDLIGCISSLTLLFIFNKSSLILWIGSILYGFSVGSIYASAISYTEKHMPITGKRMSCLAVGGSAGDALIPLLVGYSMNSKLLGSISLIFITLVITVLSSLFFVAIVLYVKHQSKKDKGNNLAVST